MAGDLFSAYLNENDCVIVNKRIYNLTDRRDTGDYVSFRNARLGAVLGPRLEDIEENFASLQKRTLLSMVDARLEREFERLQQRDALVPGHDHTMLKKRIAYEAIAGYSLSNVLAQYKDDDGRELPAEEILRVRKEVLEGLENCSFSEAVMDTPLLVIGGMPYLLEKVRLRTGSEQDILVKIKDEEFLCSGQLQEGVEGIISKYWHALEQRMESAVKGSGNIARIVREKPAFGAADALSRDEFYDRNRNIGFRNFEGAVFAFTRTPEYVLWEHITDKYYRFPPADVGVEIDINQNSLVSIKFPVVLNRYKHPALPSIDSVVGELCFMYFDRSSLTGLNTRQRVIKLLHEGCRMLMVNYCSDGHAYQNLEEENTAEEFSDLRVSREQVDMSLVTNMSSAIDYRKRWAS